MSYLGKLVFLESMDKKYSYYSGEYLCLQESPNALYCIKPVAGYGSHELKQFPLVGDGKYNIVSVADIDHNFLDGFIDDMCRFVTTPREKRQWIGSVYEGAAQILRMVDRLRPVKITHEEKINGGKVKVTIEIDK